MVIEDLAFIADQHRGVPQASDAVRRALVEAYVREDAARSACLLERAYLRAID